jgi:hypothetical protein
MTYTIWDVRPLTAAVVARLISETGKAIGKTKSPGGDPPYAVVHPQSDIESEGSLSDPHEQVTSTFQVTSVGDDLDEAQWMQYKVRQALIGWTPSITGATPIELDKGNLFTFTDLDGPVTSTTDRYRIALS